ncbi:hypothetical protein EJ06DRAFT_527430 [Trichodelitschia bisporula]|uniref:UBC core domain-containing protein n=1 Tax=Trichodelitschia bisporula TaxID=703511 RepID=A0A6G1I6Y6_9PEZI|nr:hypothetical protein EJ06DRAFT_527430 [Trichodelitschia bisporula]
MATSALSSFSRQNLLLEFASLKHACPDGVYVTITPGDPSLWTGFVCVRKGPYSPALLRFHLSFPPTYPRTPPLLTFTSDIFHPLLTPLTTHSYPSNPSPATDPDEPRSAADIPARLPPGGFSLRHGFPAWFTPSAGAASRVQSRASSRPARPGEVLVVPRARGAGVNAASTGERSISGSMGTEQAGSAPPTIYELLSYISASFSSADLLDAIPLHAAADAGAWHAWRTHRASQLGGPREGLRSASGSSGRSVSGEARAVRRPGEWNWEGVWEERVKRGVKASLSEGVLFGGGGGDEIIRFADLDEGTLARVRAIMLGEA